ncbi:MAG: large conductance mechanosensitive channel protein MscL [Chloroflexota bacterium]
MLQEFKKFILRGNVVDLAVGVVIGGAFGGIVKSLVEDIIMPPIGLLLGGTDFANLYALLKPGDPAGPYAVLADAKAAGAVTMNLGVFINTIISFLVIALAVFLVVRGINRLTEKKGPAKAEKPTTKVCPFCTSAIPLKATRCPFCTSQVK